MDKELVKIWIEVGNKDVLAVLERSKEKGGTFSLMNPLVSKNSKK